MVGDAVKLGRQDVCCSRLPWAEGACGCYGGQCWSWGAEGAARVLRALRSWSTGERESSSSHKRPAVTTRFVLVVRPITHQAHITPRHTRRTTATGRTSISEQPRAMAASTAGRLLCRRWPPSSSCASGGGGILSTRTGARSPRRSLARTRTQFVFGERPRRHPRWWRPRPAPARPRPPSSVATWTQSGHTPGTSASPPGRYRG